MTHAVHSQWEMANFDPNDIKIPEFFFTFQLDYVPEFYISANFHFNPFSWASPQATLDKIYTNIADWFKTPAIFPAICNSDHYSVMAFATSNGHVVKTEDVIVFRRVCDSNSKIL